MHCPFCAANDTKVIDSRLVAEGDQVRRRRECEACGERFSTLETIELKLPVIIKNDGGREAFDAALIEAIDGFDERFRRIWTYYLASCEAGFRTGSIDVTQVTLRPA